MGPWVSLILNRTGSADLNRACACVWSFGHPLGVGRIRIVSHVLRVANRWVGLLCLLSLQCLSPIHSEGRWKAAKCTRPLKPDSGKWDSITSSDFHGQI